MTGIVPVQNRDDRLPPKALVMGVRQGEQTRAYPLRMFEDTQSLDQAMTVRMIAS